MNALLAKRTSSELRILQISAFFPAHGGGIEVVAGELAARLPGPTLRVRWIAGGTPEERPEEIADVHVDQVRSWDPLERRIGLPAPMWSPSGLVLVWRAIREADVVHVHDYQYFPLATAMVFALIQGRPLVVTQHVGEIPLTSGVARRLLEWAHRHVGAKLLARATQVIFVGRPVMAYFERIVPFRQPPLLVPNGVDPERFTPKYEESKSATMAVARVLFVGRFVEKKGIELLRLCLNLPNTHWTLVGWGPLSPVAWPEAQQGNCQVLGRLSRDEIAVQYRQADLLVLPSTGEGFPLVLQEALACGTPVLVSREVFEAFPTVDERCVFHAELRTDQAAAALRSRLAALVADPVVLFNARSAAVALSRQWSWEGCVTAYKAIFKRAAEAQLRRAQNGGNAGH